MAAPRPRPSARPGVKLLSVVFFILLVSLSRSLFFISLAAAGVLLLLGFSRAEIILRVLAACLPASAFVFLLLVPSALWSGFAGPGIIAVKVFLSVAAVRFLSVTTAWPELGSALSVFRVPAALILVTDIALRSLSILGETSIDLLYALKLRAVGGREALAARGGIPGTLFLKSRDAARELHQGMTCRCFSGRYAGRRRGPAGIGDAALVLSDAVLAASFFLGVFSG